MILDLKDLICIVLLIAGVIIKNNCPGISIVGQAMIISSITSIIALHIARIFIRIKELTNPDKMPPPKNKK